MGVARSLAQNEPPVTSTNCSHMGTRTQKEKKHTGQRWKESLNELTWVDFCYFGQIQSYLQIEENSSLLTQNIAKEIATETINEQEWSRMDKINTDNKRQT